jgi:protein-S-isoprenylcysteine O-methyltransferase Ste14
MSHPVHSYIVLITLCLLGAALLIQGYLLSQRTQHFLGSPAIKAVWFITGKIAIFASWGLCIAKAINPELGWFVLFPPMPWFALVMLIPGSVIMAISFFQLGTSLKVGLPEQETMLKIKGLFSISRNPLYVGVYLTTVASCLYFPVIINIILAITGMIIHHLITLSEEKFLSDRFGKDYGEYRKKVRRYI